jgi:hypothetical protein
MIKEIPILFSTPMVQAILDKRKTQTRRIIKPQPSIVATEFAHHPLQWPKKPWVARFKYGDRDVYEVTDAYKCPYGRPGDALWVRETLARHKTGAYWTKGLADAVNVNPEYICKYEAGGVNTFSWPSDHMSKVKDGKKVPSIHTMKWESRIWLQKTATKVERACDISSEDAIAEGLACISKDGGRTYKYGIPDSDGLPGIDDHGWPWQEWEVDPVAAFKKLWCKINGPETWESWVWCESFAVLSTTGKPN